jgi:hypothetical protein
MVRYTLCELLGVVPGTELGKKEGCDVKIWLFFRAFRIYDSDTQLGLLILARQLVQRQDWCLFCLLSLFLGWNVAVSCTGTKRPTRRISHRASKQQPCRRPRLCYWLSWPFVETEMTIKSNDIVFAETLGLSEQLLPLVLGLLTLAATAGTGLRNVLTCHPLLPTQVPYIQHKVKHVSLKKCTWVNR